MVIGPATDRSSLASARSRHLLASVREDWHLIKTGIRARPPLLFSVAPARIERWKTRPAIASDIDLLVT